MYHLEAPEGCYLASAGVNVKGFGKCISHADISGVFKQKLRVSHTYEVVIKSMWFENREERSVDIDQKKKLEPLGILKKQLLCPKYFTFIKQTVTKKEYLDSMEEEKDYDNKSWN